MPDLKKFMGPLAAGGHLSRDEAVEAFEIIMSGDATPAQMGAFLMALRVRGETVDEIWGAASVMRAKALTVRAPEGAVDTCGTGGDGANTLNISTAAAIVVAAAGVPVAKHGNKAVSSKSGSADVLAALGVNLEATPELAEKSLTEAGIAFLMAPRYHSAMRHVAAARGELATRTIFNILGPLANPALVKRQVIGVFAKDWLVPMAEVLAALGSERAWVVHGADGLDELTTTGVTHVAELKDGKVKTFDVSPEDAGLPRAKLADIRGDSAAHNAEALTRLLAGEAGPYRDIVLLNAAAVLVVADRAENLKAGAELAASVIDNDKAAKTLSRWVEISNAGKGA